MSLKKFPFFCLLILGFSSIARADSIPPSVLKWIKPFQTQSIELSSGVLRVVMNRETVSDSMYHSVAIDGVCTALFGEAKGWGNARIDRIEVLNSVSAQGYALLDAKNTCRRVGDLNTVEVKKVVAAQTVSCDSGHCRR